MKIKTMWGLRHGSTTPELMTAWDEFCISENPQGFVNDCGDRREAWGSDLKAERFIDIYINTQDVHDLFRPPQLRGKVLKP